MKAVVKYGKGNGLVEMRDVPEPTVGDDDVLVEVKAVSVCGGDLHIFHDNHPYWPPVILGHEFSGVIAAVGSAVQGWSVGDRVVSETRTGSCGVCYTCQSGFPQACEQKRAYGIGINGAYTKFVAGPAPPSTPGGDPVRCGGNDHPPASARRMARGVSAAGGPAGGQGHFNTLVRRGR